MSQPNFDQIANQGASEYDKLSDDDLRKLINDAAKLKGLHGNIQPQRQPKTGGYIDYDAKFGVK